MIERIKEKIKYSREKLLLVKRILNMDLKDEIIRLALFKAFQEVVESYSDAIAIYLKEKGLEIGDRYTNIQKIKDLGIIDEKIYNSLIEANGLRNWIIHRYNKISDEIAIDSIKRVLKDIEEFLNIFENVE